MSNWSEEMVAIGAMDTKSPLGTKDPVTRMDSVTGAGAASPCSAVCGIS